MNPLRAAALRRAMSLTGSSGGYQAAFSGALQNRLTADWVLAGIQSADQEVRQSLRTLKARSRELSRNNPHASSYLTLKGDNVLGDEGIQLQAEVKGPDGEFVQSVNRAIEDGWKEWGEVGVCTVDGRHAWQDVERMLVTEEARDGDGFIRIVPAWRGNRFGIALQLIDADQVDVDLNEPAGSSRSGEPKNEIRMGVEIDAWGRPVAYHVWKNHPSEPTGRAETGRERIPAEQMIHWCRPYRVGQTRGIPDFAPVLLTQKMLQGYEEAELVAARIASAKGGFFERTADAVQMLESVGDAKDRFSLEVEPGLFDSLPPGWKFSQWDPTHPTSAFPDFHKAMLRTIATGLGVSYNKLAQDLEGVSFSSIRQGELSERDSWKVVQSNLWRHVHNQVYRQWLLWSLTMGAIDLPSRDPRRFHRVRWQARGWDWVDPAKDSQSSAFEVRLGVNSRSRIAAAKGRNFEDIVEELAREQELMIAAGLDPTTDMSRGGGAQQPDSDEEEEQEGREDRAEAPLPPRLELLFQNGRRARTGQALIPPSRTGARNGAHSR